MTILTFLFLLPLLAAIALAFVPRNFAVIMRAVAVGVTSVTVLVRAGEMNVRIQRKDAKAQRRKERNLCLSFAPWRLCVLAFKKGSSA